MDIFYHFYNTCDLELDNFFDFIVIHDYIIY
jgi:hypothetical protein